MPKIYDQTDVMQASLFKRLAAFVYDLMVVIAVLFAVSAVGVAINDGEAVDGPLYKSALFLAVFLFNGYFWTRSGQTIGMMAWRLRVQTIEGYSLSWGHALKRFLMAIISIAVGGLGYWWMLFSDQRMTWHDMVSSTRVVQLPKRKKD
ncbi:RDD family protein [Neptunomonas concharum]|uniref:RDD family protein n=1 Tax=Neptunomonas concharum TaxID=1031538 RepID=A0A5P1RDL7_9GAMM|nr:RDD family protein [Neptunomonas concharum]QEQ97703.1 RDD family protein [Neptunomonas concharum]